MNEREQRIYDAIYANIYAGFRVKGVADREYIASCAHEYAKKGVEDLKEVKEPVIGHFLDISSLEKTFKDFFFF